MTASPEPGDLVVVVRAPRGCPWPLDGQVGMYVKGHIDRSHHLVTVPRAGLQWAREVRPLTAEEQAAYWLDPPPGATPNP